MTLEQQTLSPICPPGRTTTYVNINEPSDDPVTSDVMSVQWQTETMM